MPHRTPNRMRDNMSGWLSQWASDEITHVFVGSDSLWASVTLTATARKHWQPHGPHGPRWSWVIFMMFSTKTSRHVFVRPGSTTLLAFWTITSLTLWWSTHDWCRNSPRTCQRSLGLEKWIHLLHVVIQFLGGVCTLPCGFLHVSNGCQCHVQLCSLPFHQLCMF